MKDWDARTYDRVSDPHQRWGERVLNRLVLHGDEAAMDAGCGSGRVTRMLLERLPRGRVYGVDQSPAMLAVAAEQLAEFGPRAILVQGELTNVQLPEPVAAIFSSATFHWIRDHDRLFRNLFGLLAPGGALVAQCGGDGNIARVRQCAGAVLGQAPFAEFVGLPRRTWRFAGAAETRTLLESAGFERVDAWLEPEPTPFDTRERFQTFLGTVILGPYQDRLPTELHERFTQRVADETERRGLDFVADYVRLNVTAYRPA